MTRVLMVCLGNICRSPLAEGILRSKVGETMLVDSAGTAGYHIGEAPDSRSAAIALEKGVDISQQKCRQFVAKDFDRFDVIFAMDASNYQNVLKLARTQKDKSKVRLIMNELYPGENRTVPDPYYGGEDGFGQVYQMLDAAIDAFLEKRNHREGRTRHL